MNKDWNDAYNAGFSAREAADKAWSKRKANGRVQEPRIKLVPFEKIRLGNQRRHLVKGLIPRTGLTVVWGPPKSGKSFWTSDVMLRVALGWQYRGRRVHQGAVVYCCFEGATGFEARTEAFRQRYLAEQTDPVPFYLVPVTLNLVRDKDDLIEAIKAEIGVINPVAVVLDTLNRSLEGSESSDEDMTAYVQACDVIREQFDCAVIIVHHCGVTGDRPRGHTSLTGSADAQLMVKRPNKGAFTVTVELMKDGAEGDTIGCDLDLVEVGKDEDGDLITSCVVIETDDQPAAATKLTANQQSYLNILQEAGRDGLTLSDWNEKARDNGLGVKRRTDLMDYRHALKEKKLIHSYADRWHAT